MANTELLEKPWLDILPPPAPAGNEVWLWLAVILVSLSVIAALFYLWKKQPRQHALQQLKRIQKRLDQNDSKHALYEINRILSKALQQNSLARFVPPDDAMPDWQAFYQRLTALQYSQATPQKDKTRQVLLEAMHWLRRISI